MSGRFVSDASSIPFNYRMIVTMAWEGKGIGQLMSPFASLLAVSYDSARL